MSLIPNLPPEREALALALEAVYGSPSKGCDLRNGIRLAGPRHAIPRRADNALTIQARYVLANITHWRGPEAQSARAKLKAWIDAP